MSALSKVLKWIAISIVLVFTAGFVIGYGGVVLKQEKLIFHPKKLAADHQFEIPNEFEEIWFETEDEETLHGLLVKQSSDTLIFYLHGNSGTVEKYKYTAVTYNNMGYDFFVLDYRGFGKSSGEMQSEEQMFADVQLAFDTLRKRYEHIIVIGYSIGTGPAAWLAANNEIDKLVLQAPYYSLIDMKNQRFSFVPDRLLKYKFETNKYIPQIEEPIMIVHGTADEVINYSASKRLSKLLKDHDHFLSHEAHGHGGINRNEKFLSAFKAFVELN